MADIVASTPKCKILSTALEVITGFTEHSHKIITFKLYRPLQCLARHCHHWMMVADSHRPRTCSPHTGHSHSLWPFENWPLMALKFSIGILYHIPPSVSLYLPLCGVSAYRSSLSPQSPWPRGTKYDDKDCWSRECHTYTYTYKYHVCTYIRVGARVVLYTTCTVMFTKIKEFVRIALLVKLFCRVRFESTCGELAWKLSKTGDKRRKLKLKRWRGSS